LLPKLTNITAATVAAVAAFGCTQASAAQHNVAQTAHMNLSRTAYPAAVAAAPPQGCQRKEAYGSSGWWAALQGCLTTFNGRPVAKIENDCQYKGVLAYSKVMCRIQGHYSVSKDGQVLQEGAVDYVGDPIHGGGTIYQFPYSCSDTGTYTLRFTGLQTYEHRPGYFPRGSGPVPDITVEAAGC
jgi:hypothetical protein